jgi:hypothetical protein
VLSSGAIRGSRKRIPKALPLYVKEEQLLASSQNGVTGTNALTVG